MVQQVKTAIDFKGLSTYPSALSQVTPGTLQRADNVLVEKPGTVSPRKGQQRFAAASVAASNLLTGNVATGTDTLSTTSGFTAGTATLASSTDTAWQGSRSLKVSGPGNFSLQVAASPGVYTLTMYARAWVGSATDPLLAPTQYYPTVFAQVSIGSNEMHTIGMTHTHAVHGFDWVRLQWVFQLASPASSADILVTIPQTVDVYLDGFQLEAGAVASEWIDPDAGKTYDIVSRLFQWASEQVGFVTADGLPNSVGKVAPLAAGDITTAYAGTFAPPPSNALRGFQSGQNLLLATADGTFKSNNATPGNDPSMLPAGAPPALDATYTLSTPASGTLGFLAGGFATAYRVLFGNTDSVGVVNYGAPSNAVVARNPGTIGDANAYWDPSVPALAASFQATANVFKVSLPFVKQATAAQTYDCYVIQGGNTLKATLSVAAAAGIGTTDAYIRLKDPLVYFGVATNNVTVVLPITVASVAAGPALTVQNFEARLFPAAVAPAVEFYETFTPADPGNYAAGTARSNLSAAGASSATVINLAGGTWTAGQIGAVFTATITTAQIPRLLKTAGTSPVLADDELSFASLADRATVSAVSTVGGFNIIDLDVFPTGLASSGAHQAFDIYRSQNVSVTFSVPPEAYTLPDSFYQIYRSFVQAEIVTGVETLPTDNMQLCYQGTFPTTGDPTTITVVDVAPDGVLGAALYTSPGQETILKARYQPPVCSDAALYQACGLYANTYSPAQLQTQLLSVPADGDTLYVADVPIIARTAAIESNEYTIVSGTGSVVNDINQTLKNLARAVNRLWIPTTNAGYPTEIVIAQVSSGDAIGVPGGALTFQASRGVGSFTVGFMGDGVQGPFVGVPDASVLSGLLELVGVYTGGTTVLPVNNPNALYFSQTNQAEAVPLLNYLLVGAANYPIKRINALPTCCLIWKDDGLFSLTGTSPETFAVTLLNNTVQLLGNETAVALGGAVVAMTSQGVIAVNEGGVQLLSQQIRADLLNLTALTAYSSTAFGVAHEATGMYYLYSPSSNDDTLPTQAYVYGTLSGAWTRVALARVCGLTNLSDQCLYTSSAQPSLVTDTSNVYREIAYRSTDDVFGDEPVTGTVMGVDTAGLNMQVDPAVRDAIVAYATNNGAALWTSQGTRRLASVIAGGSDLVTCFYAEAASIIDDTEVTLLFGYTADLQPVPITADDPGMVKQFQEVVLSFQATTTEIMAGTFASDFGYSAVSSVFAIPNQDLNTNGGAWGDVWGPQWGGMTLAADFLQTARQLVPRAAARGHSLNVGFQAQVCGSQFNLVGMTIGWAPSGSLRTR